jgi:cytochrome b561
MSTLFSRTSYSLRSKILHWISAALVILLLIGGNFLSSLPPDLKKTAIFMHKSTGLTVLLLTLLRIVFILLDHRPALPSSTPWYEKLLARTVQFALYICLIMMPISGWIMSTAAGFPPNYFGLITIPFPGFSKNLELAKAFLEVHESISWVIISLIVLHIAGNIKHFAIDKDKVVQTML